MRFNTWRLFGIRVFASVLMNILCAPLMVLANTDNIQASAVAPTFGVPLAILLVDSAKGHKKIKYYLLPLFVLAFLVCFQILDLKPAPRDEIDIVVAIVVVTLTINIIYHYFLVLMYKVGVYRKEESLDNQN